MAITEIKINEKIKQTVQEPRRWKVLFLNDDSTPMDFVITLLRDIFKHTEITAAEITLDIHTTGSGVAGVYSFEIAEVKAVEATELSRANGYPLQVKMEEE